MAKKISELNEITSITADDLIEVSQKVGETYESKKLRLKTPIVKPDKTVQAITCADNVTVDWSLGSIARMTFDRAAVTFAFTGAYDGQKCLLVLKQDATGGRTATFGSEMRGGSDLAVPPSLTAIGDKTDYLGFIYNGADAKYDFVSISNGY